jgi:ATP-dependent DNA helicase RecG
LFIEEVDRKQIIVLWIPGGPNRPYQAPEQMTAKEKRNFFYIRKYANTVKANTEEQQELISLANQIPFDDRTNTQAKLENISMLLVKDYLLKVKSRLAEQVGKIPERELLGQMELISGPNEHVFPRNIVLLLFAEQPEKFFPYTQVEIVEFPKGDAEDFVEQKPISGPVHIQIDRVLNFLKDKLIREKVIKPVNRAESIRIASYPYQAIEEIVVNAFYHRDYQQREPIEIRIYPNSIIFLNHGGPDRSIRLETFGQGQVRSRRYRNRRLGEYLKELEFTEGRATGIPTILKTLKENGSPAPRFYTDDDRTLFEVELFIHPAFLEEASFKLDGEVSASLDGIDAFLNRLLEHCGFNPAEITLSAIAGNQAYFLKSIEIQLNTVLESLPNTIVSTIASTIAKNEQKILEKAFEAVDRETLLTLVGVTNQRKNYKSYMLPMVNYGWLTMTIPNKPTSPNQKYLTTLKGRLILELLKRHRK